MLFLIQGIKCKISSGSLERCFLGKVYSAVMSLCCLEIWPKDRKEGVPLPDVDELILYYPNKSSTYYSTLDAFIVPRLFIMHFITWMFYFIKKKKRHSGENILDVSGICVMTQSILHAYIIVGEKSLTSLRYTIGSFLMLWETRPTGFLSDQYCHCVW